MNTEQKTILYVEDDEDDRSFFCTAMQETHPEIKVVVVENGQEALDYLENAKAGNNLPQLVVLDLNLPLVDGKQFLAQLQGDAGLYAVPIVVFSSSENPADAAYMYSKGISFVNKPYNISSMPVLLDLLLEHAE